MSAIKKHTTLRWQHTNEKSTGGAIIATVWTAKRGKFELEVTNYPGTRTLDWQIKVPSVDARVMGGSEDRGEYTVSTLKDMVCEKADALIAASACRQ